MSLYEQGVRVYCVDVAKVQSDDENFERLLKYVDEDSRRQIRRFHRRPDAMRCLIGRLLSRVVGASHGSLWSQVKIDKETSGRPYYTSPQMLSGKVDFNVSHDSDWVVCAYMERKNGMDENSKVGVDVMKVKLPWAGKADEVCETIRDQLTMNEYENLKGLPDDSTKTRTLMILWTHKEAVTKALGLGLSGGFLKWDFGENIGRKSSNRRSHVFNTQQDLVHQSEIFSWNMKDSGPEWIIEWVSLCDFVTNSDHIITVALHNPAPKKSFLSSTAFSSSASSPKSSPTRGNWVRILTIGQLCKHAVPL